MANSNKKLLWILIAAIIVVVAVVVVVLCSREGAKPAPEAPTYNRMENPEYLKLMETEKAAQAKTLSALAKATQNLEEAKEAKLEPEVIKELEDAVAQEQKNLAFDRQRMAEYVRREIWKEQHPDMVKQADDYEAAKTALKKQVGEAKERLAAAQASGTATDEEIAAINAEVEAAVLKLRALRDEMMKK